MTSQGLTFRMGANKRAAGMRLESGLLLCQVEVTVALLFWCIFGPI